MTYTYVLLPVSRAAYEEIRQKLEVAGYSHALHNHVSDGVVLDMHGIALMLDELDKDEKEDPA